MQRESPSRGVPSLLAGWTKDAHDFQRCSELEGSDKHKRQWIHILRSVNHERGAWGRHVNIHDRQMSASQLHEETKFWKLSKSEDSIGRRSKLKRNYAGGDYAEASVWTTGASHRADEEDPDDRFLSNGRRRGTASSDQGSGARVSARHDELLDDLERALMSGTDKLDDAELDDAAIAARLDAESSGPSKAMYPTDGDDAPVVALVRSSNSSLRKQESNTSLKFAVEVDDAAMKIKAGMAANSQSMNTASPSSSDAHDAARTKKMEHAGGKGAEIARVPCEVITPMLSTPGTFVLTATELQFIVNTEELKRRLDKEESKHAPSSVAATPKRKRGLDKSKLLHHARSKTWQVSALTLVEFRRYQLQAIALEFFFESTHATFVNFVRQSIRDRIYEAIRTVCRPPRVRHFYSLHSTPRSRLKKSRLVEAWQAREITNFDFLMRLNFFAGRTYNDLAQYPIFPWVLSDYTSETLDLRDSRVFRNLERPVAVQKDSRMEYFRRRYEQSETLYEQMKSAPVSADGLSRFFYPVPRHYSTHYSNPQIVLWYMLRLDPFTAAHIHLQDGVFDIADRQFHSIAAAWRGSNSNDHDVKELIPEFFYLPDFLKNINNLDLGVKQNTKEKLDDVVLPPWAKGSAEEFIRQHRRALESDYVSRHLHQWVDLIFGHKQRGPHLPGGSEEAARACNIFANATYEGQVAGGLERLKLERPEEFKFRIRMINSFGQTPPVLFSRPCPPRRNPEECLLVFPIFSRHCYDGGICTRIVGFDTSAAASQPMLADSPGGGQGDTGSKATGLGGGDLQLTQGERAASDGRSNSTDSPRGSRSESLSEGLETNSKVPEQLLNCTFLRQHGAQIGGKKSKFLSGRNNSKDVRRFAKVSNDPIIGFVHSVDYGILATIDAGRQMLSHRWIIDENIVSARTCSLELDKDHLHHPAFVGVALVKNIHEHHKHWPVNTYTSINSLRSTYWRRGALEGLKGRKTKLLFSGGHWDNSLTVTSVGSGKIVAQAHVRTCIVIIVLRFGFC